jgi:hypothetical protein
MDLKMIEVATSCPTYSDGDCRFGAVAPNLVRSMLADTSSDTSAFMLHFLDVMREHACVDYEELQSPILHALPRVRTTRRIRTGYLSVDGPRYHMTFG